jgi:hypothetical protein
MVSEPSFLGLNSTVTPPCVVKSSAFETPHLQSLPITLLVVPIDRSEADMSIAAKITDIIHVMRRNALPKDYARSTMRHHSPPTTPTVTPSDRTDADRPISVHNTFVRPSTRSQVPHVVSDSRLTCRHPRPFEEENHGSRIENCRSIRPPPPFAPWSYHAPPHIVSTDCACLPRAKAHLSSFYVSHWIPTCDSTCTSVTLWKIKRLLINSVCEQCATKY